MASSPITSEEGEEAEVVAEINVTPLTDIFLVLLIIFMVTTTVIKEEGKNIDLPNAEVAEETPPAPGGAAAAAMGARKRQRL